MAVIYLCSVKSSVSGLCFAAAFRLTTASYTNTLKCIMRRCLSTFMFAFFAQRKSLCSKPADVIMPHTIRAAGSQQTVNEDVSTRLTGRQTDSLTEWHSNGQPDRQEDCLAECRRTDRKTSNVVQKVWRLDLVRTPTHIHTIVSAY